MKKLETIVFLVVGLLFLAACTHISPSWHLKASEFDTLPNSIGDITVQHDAPFDLSEYNKISMRSEYEATTEYEDPTDKWVLKGGVISSGLHLPGDEIQIQLKHLSNGPRIRYQLTERNASLEKVGIVKEEISTNQQFKTDLPDKEGALYLLSAEVLDLNYGVEDTLLTLVEVPLQAINAKLYTDKEEYRSYDSLILQLENFGPTTLSFGVDYSIEKFENGLWKSLVFENMGFASIGIEVQPHDIFEQPVDLPRLPQGKYRIVKSFSADGTKLDATLAADFEVIK
ncbi:hypothetical protein GJU40_10860 [Bacillus lacus]|uniref:Bacterial Ig-like domain-containing protein n=1 Tax=Metabacillus lacus TaxID=1983721 RepID=A0A7X2IZG5_9BACI|nr:immunoglobulin-like domain-containing protein [Metabacillus lacus]MRX72647.1 hypothetical protein [Metabacillus lacus]